MTTANPFPGMNPFFEQQWRDAHTMLIAYLRDDLQEQLPSDLVARAEEAAVALGTDAGTGLSRPDVQVREPWAFKEPAPAVGNPPCSVKAADPVRVFVDEEIDRWIEILDTTGRLVTVLELLSPSNKLESAERDRYLRKRRAFIQGGVNLVEIDLVRQGTPLFPAAVRNVLSQAKAAYGICVVRATQPSAREVYPIGFRDRLPAIRVPLRTTDADVVVALQPLVNRCHERGRYHLLNYAAELEPPLSPADAAWVDEILRRQGLR
ncbi:MAG: DUF4058 family protein [Verrucomicrobia bacterium]|nr:DUF4058 family protein [Verrucomicrobiota bacterium]